MYEMEKVSGGSPNVWDYMKAAEGQRKAEYIRPNSELWRDRAIREYSGKTWWTRLLRWLGQ